MTLLYLPLFGDSSGLRAGRGRLVVAVRLIFAWLPSRNLQGHTLLDRYLVISIRARHGDVEGARLWNRTVATIGLKAAHNVSEILHV